MPTRNGIPAWLLLGLLIAVALIAVVGCGGGGATAGPVSFVVDESTEWGDLVGQFTDAERECIRAALGAERYRMVLDEPAAMQSAVWAAYPEPWAEVWEVFLWGCLHQETAVGLFWANLSASVYAESEVSEDCIRDLVAYIDFSRLVTAGLPDHLSGEAQIPNDPSRAVGVIYLGLALCDETIRENEATDEFFVFEEFWFNPGFLWSHAIDELGDAEGDCIRAEFGEVYDAVLARPLMSEAMDFRDVAAWGCITQEKAARLFAANAIAILRQSPQTLETRPDSGWSPSECQQQALARVDYPLLISAGLPERELPAVIENLAVVFGLAYCSPDAALEGSENYHRDPAGKTPTPISIG